MNKRKLMLVAVALCMVAILGFGGTLAYLTDDEQANNTMVSGDVKINIDEFTYEDGKWNKFEDDKFTQYPLANDHGNALMNKVVYTANQSTVNKLDPTSGYAYIRNIILIEANAKVTEMNDGDCCFPGIHYGYYNVDEPATSSADGKTYYGSKEVGTTTATVNIGGVDYYVVVFVEAQERAIPSDACLYSLHSVWVDKDVNSEQMAYWGTANNGKLDVIVFSQGIQADGLTHAEAMAELGEVNEDNLRTWLQNADGSLKAENAKINDWSNK